MTWQPIKKFKKREVDIFESAEFQVMDHIYALHVIDPGSVTLVDIAMFFSDPKNSSIAQPTDARFFAERVVGVLVNFEALLRARDRDPSVREQTWESLYKDAKNIFFDIYDAVANLPGDSSAYGLLVVFFQRNLIEFRDDREFMQKLERMTYSPITWLYLANEFTSDGFEYWCMLHMYDDTWRPREEVRNLLRQSTATREDLMESMRLAIDSCSAARLKAATSGPVYSYLQGVYAHQEADAATASVDTP